MPIYEYYCQSCGHEVEVLQKINDPAPATCSQCGKSTMVKKISATGFQLKGEGWYVTDYKKQPKDQPKKTESSETKTETKEKVDAPTVEKKATEEKK